MRRPRWTLILRTGDPARRDQFLRLIANGIPTVAEFVLGTVRARSHSVADPTGTVDGIVHIQLRVLTALRPRDKGPRREGRRLADVRERLSWMGSH